jgi:acyl carrier protein
MDSKLRGILANTLDIEPEELDDNASQKNMSEWDSFAHMAIVSALEEEFKIDLTLEEIMEMHSLQKIKQVLVKKLC